jgi:hypothetical protein
MVPSRGLIDPMKRKLLLVSMESWWIIFSLNPLSVNDADAILDFPLNEKIVKERE